jgi:hypothetical protein
LGSSSSSSEEEALTIVVSPVEISVIHVRAGALVAELEALEKKFDMPLPVLVASGCIQVFRGAPLELVIQKADVRARL